MFSLVFRKFLAMRNIVLYSVSVPHLFSCNIHNIKNDNKSYICFMYAWIFGAYSLVYLFIRLLRVCNINRSFLAIWGWFIQITNCFAQRWYSYRTRAIITWVCIFFTPFFTEVYIVERLVLQTIYVLNKEILQFLSLKSASYNRERFQIKNGL